MAHVTGAPDEPLPTVVLVDDSSEVRTLVRTRLRMSERFAVVGEGGNGNDAITLAYRHEPALMLLDTSMPMMDGLEALPAVLAVSPRTKVVMFTGFEQQGLGDRAAQLGAAGFIEKSIRLEDLPDRLLEILELSPAREGVGPRQRLRVMETPSEAFGEEQAVLDEHLEQFRELFDQAAIGMATLTLNGTVVRANRALATLMSCQPSDLVGVDYGRLTRGQGEVLDRALEAISELGEDLTTFEHLLAGEHDDRIARITLAPIRDSRGQALYVFAQIQDITAQRMAEDELRRSEQNFRLLVSAVSEYAIFMLDPTGRVISWNAGAQRIKGYRASEIVGRHFRVFYPQEEQDTGHPENNLSISLREGEHAEEGWRVRKDGSTFWASVVITAIHDDSGRHVGFAKVTRDLTKQRQYEEERRRAIEQQTHLLAVTAHELRTPTAVIDGSAGTLQHHWEHLAPDERAELLAAIRSSTHRLHRLFSDLATASRLQSDTLRLNRRPLSLEQVLREAVSRAKVAKPGTQVEVDVPHSVSFTADPDRLGQAIDNLLDNAVRHGDPPITLGGAVDDDAVRIFVRDTGPGVPEELTPRLFERFAIAGPTGGTGLGLFLVREIARGHGGQAAYHAPSEGRAPTFEIRLPRESAAQPA